MVGQMQGRRLQRGSLALDRFEAVVRGKVQVTGMELGGLTGGVADYGTNGEPSSWSWSRPNTIPSTSSTLLVTKYAYDITGEPQLVTVPSGTAGTQVTRREYDRAARLTQLIENYLSGQSDPDKNKTTEF